MKKLLLSILAIAAITACSKMDVEYDAPTEIGVSPVAQNITRTMVETTTFPDEQFNVWAFYKQIDAGTSIAAWQQATSVNQQIYIEHKPFEKRSENLWGGVTPYYWPKVGSLLFAGYCPVNATLKGKVSYTFNETDNIMTIAGYTPGDYLTTGFVVAPVTSKDDLGNDVVTTTYNEDLMYFNMTETSYDGSTVGKKGNVTSGSNVDVVFKHALSWVTVYLAETAGTPDGATIKVNSVKFTDVKTTGTGTVNNSAVTAAAKEIAWETTNDKTDIVILNTETVLGASAKVTKEPVIIPQGMAGDLVVNYTISSGDGSSFSEEKTFTLSGMKDSEDNTLTEWKPGKHYIYTISIGTTEILIDPVVTAWTPVEVSVPVQ